MTPPLAQRLRDAADAIEELSRMQGYSSVNIDRVPMTPMNLRREARVLETPDADGKK